MISLVEFSSDYKENLLVFDAIKEETEDLTIYSGLKSCTSKETFIESLRGIKGTHYFVVVDEDIIGLTTIDSRRIGYSIDFYLPESKKEYGAEVLRQVVRLVRDIADR